MRLISLISGVNPFSNRLNRTAGFELKGSYFRESRKSPWKKKGGTKVKSGAFPSTVFLFTIRFFSRLYSRGDLGIMKLKLMIIYHFPCENNSWAFSGRAWMKTGTTRMTSLTAPCLPLTWPMSQAPLSLAASLCLVFNHGYHSTLKNLCSRLKGGCFARVHRQDGYDKKCYGFPR